MVYPGNDHIREELVFRSLGEPSRRQRIGCGFMYKGGVSVDEYESYFSSYALVYVIRGRGKYITEQGQEIPLEPGSLFQRHPGILHSTLLDPESRWLECFLDFGEDMYRALVSMRLVFPDEPLCWLPPDSGIEEEFYRIMMSLKEASERELPHYSMEILQFCASLLERSRKGDEPGWDRVELSCRDFNRMIDKRFDLKEYCYSRGWGYESFRKVFYKKMGLSPGQYIIQIRMDEACRLLRIGDLTVKETALRLGYKSPYEFSAQFRRYTGWSPRDYRGAQPLAAP
ncbi:MULTISPECIES: AraC family transcriptional regulator [unclassified Oceanispirochaeta]|uniref:helix-turn-helix domain-containing protein n=1 Tax=unclassified Oceanispirochaeta TaxID=2635722 RepID=UPI000E08DB8F|nr:MULTISPECIES: helix-turn-helix domain-containing protein [unclassified Oceanispirochaeta]MBF9014240.1 helix-turn-helix domain-containing protein [Oceanispirochaeta sp. M2]NPD71126.1 helix-turn-helix transcriptional regulator [Oceanispirochaeta sp. M1]RDG33520.1 AraC family transcriptional regulator [Oceanispirochaeta sp. M1]